MHFEMCTSNACYCITNNNFAFNHAYTRDGEKSANSLYLIWSGRADLPSGMKNNDTGRINFCCIALVNFHFSSCLSHKHTHTQAYPLWTPPTTTANLTLELDVAVWATAHWDCCYRSTPPDPLGRGISCTIVIIIIAMQWTHEMQPSTII